MQSGNAHRSYFEPPARRSTHFYLLELHLGAIRGRLGRALLAPGRATRHWQLTRNVCAGELQVSVPNPPQFGLSFEPRLMQGRTE